MKDALRRREHRERESAPQAGAAGSAAVSDGGKRRNEPFQTERGSNASPVNFEKEQFLAHSHAMPQPVALPGVAKIVAVGSGKGGVGKTTVAVNLAVALSRLGQRVGLIDADIYGPNVPMMMGSTQQPNVWAATALSPI
jgi:Mrp family chromosome partitioning ATPase